MVGLLVDQVAEVAYMRSSQIESAPDVGNDESAKYIQGVVTREEGLLILIDVNKLLSKDEWQEMAESTRSTQSGRSSWRNTYFRP